MVLQCPKHYNPADFLLELVTDEELTGGSPKLEQLADAFHAYYTKHKELV